MLLGVKFRFVTFAACILLLSVVGGSADEFEINLRRALALSDTAQVNWPPRSQVVVGSVFLPDGTFIDRIQGEIRIEKQAASRFEIGLPPERLVPQAAFWQWRTVVAAREMLDFRLIVGDATVERLDQPQQRSSPDQRGRLITRVWRAAIAVEARPRPSVSPESWSALVDAALTDVPPGLEVGPNSLRLNLGDLAIATDAGPELAGIAKTGPTSGPRRWALATIASGRYARLANLDQYWNPESANLARAALSDWKPVLDRSLAPAERSGIVREQVLNFVDDFSRRAKGARAELLVVYYIGHMERTRTGSMSLLMGDAPPDRDKRSPAPSGLSNLRDLAQVIDQVGAELAPDAGTLDVAVLHRRIGKGGIPFVLLVDGCLEDRSYAAARDRLGIVVDARGGQPLYVGPGDAGSALRAMVDRLSAYPQDFPWLRSRDATILGATPGTLAYSEGHPEWLLGPPVGPIAQRLAGAVARTRYDQDRPNLIRILNFAADRQAIGPQELAGTVSWSDWLPYLRRFDPLSFKR